MNNQSGNGKETKKAHEDGSGRQRDMGKVLFKVVSTNLVSKKLV